MRRSSLLAEIRALMRRYVVELIELVELVDDVGLSPDEFLIDAESRLQTNIDRVVHGILERPGVQRNLARSLLKKYPQASLPFAVRMQLSPWGGVLQWGLIAVLFFVAIGLTYFVQNLLMAPAPTRDSALAFEGNLLRIGDDYYVELEVTQAFLDHDDVFVLLPPRRNGVRKYDVCHLAVRVQRDGPLPDVGTVHRFLGIDFELDTQVCPIPLADFVSEAWSVRIDAAEYPATHLLRASQIMAQIKDLDADDPLREKLYLQAAESFAIARRLYERNEAFFRQAPVEVQSRRRDLMYRENLQRIEANSVSRTPKHEMILLSGGRIERWDEDPSERETVSLEDFWLDRHEVSNFQFAQLKAQLTDPTADPRSPVRKVTASQGSAYCRARGLRLPSDIEFERAAGWDPQSRKPRPYPWGYEPPTNSVVGLRPVQHDDNPSSPEGVRNLAGNVSEWTLRRRVAQRSSEVVHVIKGGSYRRHSAEERVGAREWFGVSGSEEDVGFRCASTQRPGSPDILLHEPLR